MSRLQQVKGAMFLDSVTV